MTKINSV